MAGEFHRPGGDSPYERDPRKDRQMPDILRHHDGGEGGAPREIREKKKPLRSPRDTYQRCTDKITRSLEYMPLPASPESLDALSKVYTRQGDSDRVRRLGERLEVSDQTNPQDDDINNKIELGSIYWRAAQLGDAAAAERLHTLLQTEKDQALLEGEKRTPKHSKLRRVITACAEYDVPADSWIETYALNPDDIATAKQMYWWRDTKDGTQEPNETSLRYRAELTDQYLNGEGVTTDYAFRHAQYLYGIHDNKGIKRQMFERFQELPRKLSAEGELFDTGTFYTFCDFATRYLEDKGVARPQDVEWIEQFVEQLSSTLNYAGHKPETISAYAKSTKLSIERYRSKDPQTIIPKLDILEGEQENLKQAAGALFISDRDSSLYGLAREALETKNADATRTYLTALGEDTAMTAPSAKKLFDSIKTIKQLEAIKPDDMELLFKENLATFFETKRILLGENADDIENLVVNSETTTSQKPLTIKKHVQTYAIKRLYEVDADRAHAVTATLITEAPDYESVAKIAKTQIANGDTTGWETLFNAIGAIRPNDLQAYAELAEYAAKVMTDEETLTD